MKRPQQSCILKKQLLQIPLDAVKLYDKAADELRRIYQRPPTGQTLMLQAIVDRGIEDILSDFRHKNEVNRKYPFLTPLQRRIRRSFEKIQAARNNKNSSC